MKRTGILSLAAAGLAALVLAACGPGGPASRVQTGTFDGSGGTVQVSLDAGGGWDARFGETEARLYDGAAGESAPAAIGTCVSGAEYTERLAMAGGLLATLAVSGAVWAQGAVFRPQHRIAIERVQGLCEYILFPKFDAGLRESFMAEVSNTLPKGYSIAAPGSGDGADLLARISVRQTPRQTVVVVNLVDRGGGRLLWSGQFVGATDTNDYLPLQRALAQHMARGLRKALAERA